MEKFQNFLNMLGGNLNNFRKNIGFTTKNFQEFINTPIEKSNNPSVRDGTLKPENDLLLAPFLEGGSVRNLVESQGTFTNKKGEKTVINPTKTNSDKTTTENNTDSSKVPSFKDVFDMPFDEYLGKVSKLGERAKDRDALRSGISNLALSPLIGGQAAMDAAANVGKLTGVNLAAMANQNAVLAQNPTKQKIAGKYFR
tara:strand:- start:403 stop:996 length:594 start_codon:yes stop_codon:yes gene_type:complete